MKALLLPAAALLATGAAEPPKGAPIEVTVSGVRALTGQVIVAICPERQFLKTCAYSGAAAAHGGTVVVTVPNVPPGRYAAQAFADADDDGKLGRTMVGIPKEGVGFSNNAMRRFLPPKFSSAAFDHGAGQQHIAIALRYMLG